MAFIKRSVKFEKKNFIVKKEYKHQVYDINKEGRSLFRIFPEPLEGGGFAPQIVPVDGDQVEGLSNSFAFIEIVSVIQGF